MDKYEVVLKGRDGHRWTMTWNTYSFRSAESLTKEQLERYPSDSEIVAINRDYEIKDGWGYPERTLEERAESPGHP